MMLPLVLALVACTLSARAYNISHSEQGDIDRAVADFLSYPDEKMWSVSPAISTKHPFIFFHQRKCGGSSFRATLRKAAAKLNLKTYIPCMDGVSCDMYSFNHLRGNQLPVSGDVAVFAGHFTWGEQHDLARWGREANIACTTNYREPVSRIVSCLYYRHKASFGNKCINDLTVEMLRKLLFKRDEYGDSCLNEPFFIMSGIKDRPALDHLQEDGETWSRLRRNLRNGSHESPGRQLLGRGAAAIIDFTLQHTAKCAPIVLELHGSENLVAARFPDLGKAGGFKEEHANRGQKKQTCQFPTGEHLETIRSQSRLETIVYDAVFLKVQAQMNKTASVNVRR